MLVSEAFSEIHFRTNQANDPLLGGQLPAEVPSSAFSLREPLLDQRKAEKEKIFNLAEQMEYHHWLL